MASELVQSLLQRHGGEPLPLLSSLVDAVSDRDRALLDELERLIHEKRRAADRGKEPMTTLPSCCTARRWRWPGSSCSTSR